MVQTSHSQPLGFEPVMARIRYLRNAPITEAIVDFRVALPRDFRAEQLRSIKERLAGDYPHAVERKGMQALLEFAGAQKPEMRTYDVGFQGIWLKSDDQKRIGQFRIDGFTFNRLKPYTSWDEIRPEALRLWNGYVDVAKPQSVTRVALRYINHMTLPKAAVEWDNYIVTVPSLPKLAPQELSSFATRVVLKDPERQLTANVTQVLEVDVETAMPTLVLDIDVFRTGDFAVTQDALQPILEALRLYKNEIFFGSLTEQFAEAYA